MSALGFSGLRRAVIVRLASIVASDFGLRAPASLALVGVAHARPADPRPAEPEYLVRLRSNNVEAFKAFVREYRVQFASAPPRIDNEGHIAGVVLMKKRALDQARQTNYLRVEVIAGPPRSPEEVPKVGRGNRFSDPNVLPQGRGQLLPQR